MIRGEFRDEGGIPCQGGNSVSSGEFRVEGGIPCRGGNSVSRGEFRVDGGIPCRWGNSVLTEFRGHPTVHPVEKNFKKCFYFKYGTVSLFFRVFF
jgi:hypothetical protein